MWNLYFCKKPYFLKELVLKYKPVIRFITLFLGSYIILSIGYSYYLNASKGGVFYPDYITQVVAKQSSVLIEFIGFDSKIVPHDQDPSQKLFINDSYTVRIVEGCNAISVLILFVSFIISFAEDLKKTMLFLILGSVLIYLVNIVRIAILSIVYYTYPQYQEPLHRVVFPAIIYGIVFLLWMVWIRILKYPKVQYE